MVTNGNASSFLFAHLAYTGAFYTRAGFLFDTVALLPYLAVAAVMISLLWKRTAANVYRSQSTWS